MMIANNFKDLIKIELWNLFNTLFSLIFLSYETLQLILDKKVSYVDYLQLNLIEVERVLQ